MNENEKIDSLIKELSLLPGISNENARKLEAKFRLEFNFNSNHIEGNTLTYGETKLLLIFDKTEGAHDMREFEEMKAHDVAYRWIKELAEDKSYMLIERDIKQLNQIILVRPFWKEAETPDGQATRRQIQVGEYKQHPNSVRLQNGEIFHYASPIDTPMAMHELMDWYYSEVDKKELRPVELAAILHYKFVLIHPFDDGNGRISRLLMNYVLLSNDLPPVIIKSADKKNYLNALNQADTGNLNAFVKYIAQQLIWSLNLQLKATKGESIEDDDDVYKQVALFKKEQLNIYNNKPIKTFELVTKVYRNLISKVIIDLEHKVTVFDDLFEEVQTKYYLKFTQGKTKEELFDNLYSLDTFINTEIDNFYNLDVLNSTEINLNAISWEKEFKSSINEKIANTRFKVQIIFEKRSFIIELYNTSEVFQFPYVQNFTESEITSIVNNLYKGVFEKIQANTQK
ncbi:Fic family protein [Emticicia agri]|uniref:Fic family protein n=2 Tax=Emticicia agri TaxID=2492393 RepID=A0A4V1ZCY1_9BACT|nr:Fic family protein [Emticicia agri]